VESTPGQSVWRGSGGHVNLSRPVRLGMRRVHVAVETGFEGPVPHGGPGGVPCVPRRVRESDLVAICIDARLGSSIREPLEPLRLQRGQAPHVPDRPDDRSPAFGAHGPVWRIAGRCVTFPLHADLARACPSFARARRGSEGTPGGLGRATGLFDDFERVEMSEGSVPGGSLRPP